MENKSIKEKKLMVFDLDGTLTESKQLMDEEMGALIDGLLKIKKVAIISGGRFEQFKKQLPALKASGKDLTNLFFFPTSGTRFYKYDGDWKQIYAEELSEEERVKIKEAFEKSYEDIGYTHPDTLWGEVVEDRGTQITFSALGQQAPLDEKKKWRASQDRRSELINALKKYIPEFEIKKPGVTSIDITRKGIDKSYGVKKMVKYLGVKVSDMLFVGDALYEGGNDHPVLKTGIEAIAVKGPEETKVLLRNWLED